MPVKYVFVTGGVVSGLGKGITAASLGRLLKARGYKVTMQKFDPYINIDPGTMNPVQHGEVFVTDDGAETDLDLGHYERFIDESLTRNSNVTTGKVYWTVLHKERRGDFGGGTLRLGSYPCVLDRSSRAYELYQDETIHERHRHRYEVNNDYRGLLTQNGMKLSGLSPDGRIVEMIEIPSHPWFIATQAHPELKSRPNRPHPLFRGFIEAALKA